MTLWCYSFLKSCFYFDVMSSADAWGRLLQSKEPSGWKLKGLFPFTACKQQFVTLICNILLVVYIILCAGVNVFSFFVFSRLLWKRGRRCINPSKESIHVRVIWKGITLKSHYISGNDGKQLEKKKKKRQTFWMNPTGCGYIISDG